MAELDSGVKRMVTETINLYCRVSTEDQNVEQQVEFGKAWFERAGFIIGHITADKESGKLPLTERKQFHEHIKKSLEEARPVGIVKLDRLTRNWYDENLLERHFRENWNKSRLISAGETIDLKSAMGRAWFRVCMVIACLMPEQMLEAQRIGIDRAKTEGKYKGGIKGRTWNWGRKKQAPPCDSTS